MATKKEKDKKGNDPKSAAEKEAKRKARMEALKNRPEGQRTNSKQIDVINIGEGKVVENYGYPIKNKDGHVGVLVTSVVKNGEDIVSTSVTFVPGNLTVKAKKGHGTLVSPKAKKDKKDKKNKKGDEDNED